MQLSDQSEKKIEARRSLQWKLKTGLWIGILLIAQHVLKEGEPPALQCAVLWLFIVFTFLDFLWTQSNQMSHVIDQRFHLFYRSEINKLLRVENSLEPEHRKYPDVASLKTAKLEGSDKNWAMLMSFPTAFLTLTYFVAFAAIAK